MFRAVSRAFVDGFRPRPRVAGCRQTENFLPCALTLRDDAGDVVCGRDLRPRFFRKGRNMKKAWKKPEIVEIAVGLEINSYACAELKK
jgi:coenzyme PQQ precursor peptide PqqA